MPIYRGTTPLKAYKGDMQPVNVYRGSTKVAGWHSASHSGTSPLTVDCDYNVPPDALTIDGKCVQTGTPSPDSPAPISTITGNVTITGADGASSNTITVALGSNVCGSLPDGTHDSYDAVTGVLTKKVGKVVEASGTSWAISDAASGSSILSDCFGEDALSGTGFSAYDAVCQPNLTPFFSHDLTDSSYWASIDTAHITQLTEGWAHVSCDNSAGTSVVVAVFRPTPQDFIDSSFAGTLLVEIQNTVGNFSVIPVKNNDNSSAALTNQIISTTKSMTVIDGTYLLPCTATGYTTLNYMISSYFMFSAGVSAACDIRLSLYEGTYTGAYKPYALPCAPTVYYKLATPTTVQLTPHLPIVRTGIKTLSIGADVAPNIAATVKAMD